MREMSIAEAQAASLLAQHRILCLRLVCWSIDADSLVAAQSLDEYLRGLKEPN